jgi:glycosyltransferase involved in cell wall biosynthesis
MRDVLIVTRNFAPTSHVSVERAMKLVKYLPEFGWRPSVLTGARATAGLPEDPALASQVAGAEVIRSRAPEFSRFYGGSSNGRRRGKAAGESIVRRGVLHPKAWLIPDSQALWYPFAVRAATRRARAGRWDVVVGTCFPPTAILIAHTIAARLGVPYVADFRDSWTNYHSAPRRPAPLAELERRLEARMIRDAAAVVAVDAHIVDYAFSRVAVADRPPMYVIPNGYDEDDFRGTAPAALPAFSIVHTGRLRRSPRPLWQGLAAALRERPDLGGGLHFWQVGVVDASAAGDLEHPPEGVTVHQVPPVSQREAVGYMLGADLLLVEEFGSIFPSKGLQYLRASRPILALVDRGRSMRHVLQQMPQASLVDRRDPARIAAEVIRLASGPRVPLRGPSEVVEAYSRREIARRFAAVLDGAHARVGVPRSAGHERLRSARSRS